MKTKLTSLIILGAFGSMSSSFGQTQANTIRVNPGTDCSSAISIDPYVTHLNGNTFTTVIGDNLNPGTSGNDLQPDLNNDNCWIGLNADANHSVWYSFTAQQGRTYTVTSNVGAKTFDTDTQIAIWESCGGLNNAVIACNDNAEDPCDPANLSAATSFTAPSSGTFYIQIDLLGDLQGKFGIIVYENDSQPGRNDFINNAISIQGAYNALAFQNISNAGTSLFSEVKYDSIGSVLNLDEAKVFANYPNQSPFNSPTSGCTPISGFIHDRWFSFVGNGQPDWLNVFDIKGELELGIQVFVQSSPGNFLPLGCSAPDGNGITGLNDQAIGSFLNHPRVSLKDIPSGSNVFVRVYPISPPIATVNSLPSPCTGFIQLVFEKSGGNCFGPDGVSQDNGTCLDTAAFTLTPEAEDAKDTSMTYAGLSNAYMFGGLSQNQGSTNQPGGRDGEPGEFTYTAGSSVHFANCNSTADSTSELETSSFPNNNSAFYPFSVYDEIRVVPISPPLVNNLNATGNVFPNQVVLTNPITGAPILVPGEAVRVIFQACFGINIAHTGNNLPPGNYNLNWSNSPVNCNDLITPCGADVQFRFNNLKYHGINGRTFEAFVVPLDSIGGFGSPIQSYFGTVPNDDCDTCAGMASVNYYLPEGNYALVVDGDEGNLVEFDLEMDIAYFVPGTGISCAGLSPSNIQIRQVNPEELSFNSSLDLFPNPTRGNVQMQCQSDFSGPAHIVIRNTSGLIVHEHTQALEFGDNQWNLNLDHLNPGMYLVELYFRGDMQSIKFMKQ